MDFAGARLDGALLRDAYLSNAKLADARGLSVEQLAGADLRSATLPEGIGDFDQLEGVAEASKYFQTIYRFLLVLCGFAALTVMSVRDENLVLRDGQSITQLPLLQADVSPQVFAYVVPGLVIILYGYLLLYTVSLWRLLSFLPAYFPDGEPLDRRAYPSMMNIFVRYGLRRIKNEANDGLSYGIHWLVAFGLPPLTLAVIWFAGLKKHDALLSLFQVLSLGIAAFLAAASLLLSGSMIRNEWKIKDVSLLRFAWKHRRCLVPVAAVAAILIVGARFPAVFEQVPDIVALALVAAVVVLGTWDVASRVARGRYAEATPSLLLNCLALAMSLHYLALVTFSGSNPDLKPIWHATLSKGHVKDEEIDEVFRNRRWNSFPRQKFGAVWPETKGHSPRPEPPWNPLTPLMLALKGSRFSPFLDFRNKVISRRPRTGRGRLGRATGSRSWSAPTSRARTCARSTPRGRSWRGPTSAEPTSAGRISGSPTSARRT